MPPGRRSLLFGAGALVGRGGYAVKLALLVAYDGTGFRGFARQRGDVRTVQGELEAALTRVCRSPVEVVCAGRTDAGVHAAGQVVSFSADVVPPRLAERLTKMLGPEIAVRAAAVVADDFSARFSARRRAYEYRCYRSEVLDPFRDRFAVRISPDVRVSAMRAGARALVGEHDFSSFCRRGQGGLVRHVRRIAIVPEDDVLTFKLEADSFCHQMVRSIVGLLLEVGRGARDPSDVRDALRARDRAAAGPVAPARGLHLVRVGYRPDPFARA